MRFTECTQRFQQAKICAKLANGCGFPAGQDQTVQPGKLRWQASVAHPPAHALTAVPGMLLSASLDGHLRAFSTIGGKIVWDTDTAQQYHTVNEVPAQGGAPGHGGVIVVDGMVYVNSGNALLAFSIDGK
jgi:outer membrane protein assembly factor BamB